MIIHEASQYFGYSPKALATSLKKGIILVGNKEIPINLGGGILNYQAAMSMSGATGLIDIATRYDLAVNLISRKLDFPPRLSLLGGNEGIDSINSVVFFASEKSKIDSRRPVDMRRIYVNEMTAETGENGMILIATNINFNPGGDKKPPYVICAIRTEKKIDVINKSFQAQCRGSHYNRKHRFWQNEGSFGSIKWSVTGCACSEESKIEGYIEI